MRWQIGQESSNVARTRRVRGRHTACAGYIDTRGRHTARAAYIVLPLCLVCLVLCTTVPVRGQSEHNHVIFLPSARGGTPLSYQIQAQASYVAAYGNMVESVAVARKVNAEAVALEIQNSVDYVDAYFKRREMNREARAKENPNYLEHEKRRLAVVERRIEEQYQDLMRGNLTDPLNWLLRELSSPVVAYQYMPETQTTFLHSEHDRPISANELQQIWLTDGGSKASRLIFRAADGRALQTQHWPFGLRGPECATARENFESTRDDVLKEMRRNGQTSYDNQTRMLQTVNALFMVLDDVYPKERRTQDPQDFLTYTVAKRFLQSTLAATHRAINTANPSALSGNLSFQGDSVIGLVEHMYRNGLEFAAPEAGGEGTYKTLFQNLRSLYLKIGPNRAAVDVRPARDGAFGGDQDKPGNK